MTTTPKKTDRQIRDMVLVELRKNPACAPETISVDVWSGIATLGGTVNSWARKFAAREAAHRVGGVFEVVNNIVVQPEDSGQVTDAEITDSVKRTLGWDLLVPAGIRLAVSGGVVTLEGPVDAWSEARDIERAILDLPGIRGIVNRLKVESSAMADLLSRAVQHALTQHAAQVAQQLKVEMDGSRVTVTGHLDSRAERVAVLGAVRRAPGVTSVQDVLSIGEEGALSQL